MTKPRTSDGAPYWKVRVALPGSILHLASRAEPEVTRGVGGQIIGLDAVWLTGPEYGDTIGHIRWSAVLAVTWRLAPRST